MTSLQRLVTGNLGYLIKIKMLILQTTGNQQHATSNFS